MREIKTENDIEELLHQDNVVVFFHADWSEYAKISKLMVEHIERYHQMAGSRIKFWYGQFEGDKVPLGKRLVNVGVPILSFKGDGSLSFFQNGNHRFSIGSVIGEGTYHFNQKIEEYNEAD